jgi:hypothetical protein
MNRFLKMAAVAGLVVVLGVAALGAVAFAQEGLDDSSGWNFRDRMQQAIASILGITVEKYEAAIDTAEEQVLEEAVADGWLTQEQADRIQERLDLYWQAPRMGKGFWGPVAAWDCRGSSLISVAADALEMSPTELMEEFKAGKSIADVAGEKGVDPQDIADTYLAQYAEKLDEAVKDERITQKQADQMLANMEEAVVEQLDAACGGCWMGGFGGHRGRGRGGWFGGFPGWGPF